MPVRVRFTKDDKPAPCVVRLPPPLAQFVYREKRKGSFKDETELVCAIVRKWTEGLTAVDWPQLLAELKTEDGEWPEEEAPPEAEEKPAKGKKPK